MKVYLAGGMKSNWQDMVLQRFPDATYLDPRGHGIHDEREYTQWDTNAIRECDIVFACMEDNNPSGYGMTFEIGFASALGKTIIFVDERSPVDSRFRNYMGMCRASSIHASSISLGLYILGTFLMGGANADPRNE